MVSCDTDDYGAHFGYTRNTVVRIHLRAVLAICAQRERERERRLNKFQYSVIVSILKSINSNISS